MKQCLRSLMACFGLALPLFLTACNDNDAEYSDSEPYELAFGKGTIHAYLLTDKDDYPQEIGVEISADAFDGLPKEMSDGAWDIYDKDGNVVWHCCGHELFLPLHGIEKTPFKHIVVNWNPHGHMPPGIFDLAHFDFHFYTISEKIRTSIAAPTAEERCLVPDANDELQPVPLDCKHYATAIKPLPADLIPKGYIDLGAVEPGMGNHLLNPAAPEMNGEIFTHTWIWGAWDGDIAFYEPMITLEYLQSLRDEKIPKQCVPVSMPKAMSEANWYPTSYCMEYEDTKEAYQISLEDWKWFDSKE